MLAPLENHRWQVLGRAALIRNLLLNPESLDRHGKTQFRDLLFRRGEPRFYTFDLLWCDSEDLRNLPLVERKLRLRSVVPEPRERLLYCDHVEADGEGLFQLACEHDLEGIVAGDEVNSVVNSPRQPSVTSPVEMYPTHSQKCNADFDDNTSASVRIMLDYLKRRERALALGFIFVICMFFAMLIKLPKSVSLSEKKSAKNRRSQIDWLFQTTENTR